MIDEQLQEDAALHASGAMSQTEREEFELLLHFNPELRELVNQLNDVAAIALNTGPANAPSPGLKSRVLAATEGRPQQTRSEALVVAGPDALVEWISPEFTAMCGYTLDELRGKKLGPILQGELTDRDAAERLRAAVYAPRRCTETLVNYRKDGSAYRVTITLTPIFKSDGALRCYVAREREVIGAAA